MDEVNQKNSDFKKIIVTLILILTVVVTVTSGTYAYFALTASNSTAITATAASTSLDLRVSEVAPNGKTSTGVMVPQLESHLGTAMNSTNQCVDGNQNVVCKVYSIQITNNSSAAAVVDGYITFANSTTMPNLKWRLATGATTLGSNAAQAANVTTKQSLVSDVTLAQTNGTQTYYIVVWIDEINNVQTDSGTFTATISFEGDDGKGITSTITS